MKINLRLNHTQLLTTGIILLMIFSIVSLSYIERRESRLNAERDFWTVSFVDPSSNSLDFSIENYSAETNFHWSATAGKDKPFAEGNVTIEPGEKQPIALDSMMDKKKVVIKVSTAKGQQEIYKNLD